MKKTLYLSLALMGSAWADQSQETSTNYISSANKSSGTVHFEDDTIDVDNHEEAFELRKEKIGFALPKAISEISRHSGSINVEEETKKAKQAISGAENHINLDDAIFKSLKPTMLDAINLEINHIRSSEQEVEIKEKAELQFFRDKIKDTTSIGDLRSVMLPSDLIMIKQDLKKRIVSQTRLQKRMQDSNKQQLILDIEADIRAMEESKKKLEVIDSVERYRVWVNNADVTINPLTVSFYS